MKRDEKDSKEMGRAIAIVPTEVRDLDFSQQANEPPGGSPPRKKVPLNPSPLPQGGPIPADEVLDREDGD